MLLKLLPVREPQRLALFQSLVGKNFSYGGYSGNLLSPYYGHPTMAQRPRQVQVGMQFRF